MPWLSKISLTGHPYMDDVAIELPPGDHKPFRHLVLTGPNGSGKTTLLTELIRQFGVILGSEEKRSTGTASLSARWEPGRPSGETFVHSSILVFLPARRHLSVDAPSGPRALGLDQKISQHQAPLLYKRVPILLQAESSGIANLLEQYLVNIKTERVFAQIDERYDDVARLGDWWDTWSQRMLDLLGIPDGAVVFDSKNYRISFHSRAGREFGFDGLADGHASALQMLGEILLHVIAVREARGDNSYHPEGVVIIDELETHLHIEMQEKLLPALTAWFPNVQFIVATHSPAVISSVDNAIIFDLESRRSALSDDLRGVRYGDLMTSHFGIETDYDLDSTAKVRELQALASQPARTPEQDRRLRDLAKFLAERSHVLGLQVWTRLQYQALEQADPEAES